MLARDFIGFRTCIFLSCPNHEPLRMKVDELIDMPIDQDVDDILDRKKFVEDFFAQIRDFSSQGPFVFGLNAPWAAGKTSALNLLRNRINKDRSLILVDFNPWYFQSPETILRRFYDNVAVSNNREFFLP